MRREGKRRLSSKQKVLIGKTSIRPKPSQSPSRVIQGNVMAPIHFLVCETAKGVPASDVRTKEEKAGDKMQRVDEMKMCGLDCF